MSIKGILKKHNLSHEAVEEILEAVVDGLKNDSVKVIPKTYPIGYLSPEKHAEYWHIDEEVTVNSHTWVDDSVDRDLKAFGNCFETEGQAQQALEQKLAYGELVNCIHELNEREGWVCEWYNDDQEKYYFDCYDHDNEGLETDSCYTNQFGKTELHFGRGLKGEILKKVGAAKIKLALWGIR